jgi:hypothetical protein
VIEKKRRRPACCSLTHSPPFLAPAVHPFLAALPSQTLHEDKEELGLVMDMRACGWQ